MPLHFTRHYTQDEARALLPAVKEWLEELSALRQRLFEGGKKLEQLMASRQDAGGPLVNDFVRNLIDSRALFAKFQEHQIQIKDLDRGLVDFPAILGDREVFLCWEKGEEDVEFWHDLDSGYSGREAL